MITLYNTAVESIARCAENCVYGGLRGKALEVEIYRLAAEHNLSTAIITAGITGGKARASRRKAQERNR